MTVSLCPTFGIGYQGFTASGIPLNAGLLYTYIAGGTTPQPTYTTSAGNVQNANPIVLAADGRPPSEVWITDGVAYRFDLTDALGNLIKTYDNISNVLGLTAALAASSGSSLVGFIQAGTGAVATTVQAKLRERVSLADFGALPATADNGAAILSAITYCAANNKTLFVSGLYPMTTAVSYTAMCDIECDTGNCGFTWNGSSASCPFTFNLSAAQNFVRWDKVGIFAGSSGNGTHGLAIVIAGGSGQLANFSLNLNIEGFAQAGLLLDNSLNSASSIFMGNISGYIANGVKGLLIGDSISIDNINLPSVSPSIGNTEIGVNCTFFSGAKDFFVGSNTNITTGGGSIALTNAIHPQIYAECEYLTTFTYNPGTMNGGQVYLHNCSAAYIGGSIETGKGTSSNLTPTYAIVLDGSTCIGNTVDNCRMNYGESTNHILFSSSSYGNIIGGGNQYNGASNRLKFILTNPQAYPQIGIPLNLTSGTGTPLLINSWVLDTTNGDTQITLVLGIDGVAHLYGQVKTGSGAIMTMPPPVVATEAVVVCPALGVDNAGAVKNNAVTVLNILAGAGAQIGYVSGTDANHAGLSGFQFPYYLTH